MKKILLACLAVLTALPMMAELQGDGYYRLQNAKTKRYAYLLDDKGSMDMATSSADVNALQLWAGFYEASSDPSTVFKITNYPNTGSKINYDIAAQGTSIYTFLATYLKILDAGMYDGQQSYYAYAQKSGFTKYIGDIRNDLSISQGYPSADAKGDNRKWYIDPIDSDNDDAYFGVAPTLKCGTKYYQPFYADFPIKAKSDGMKIYVTGRTLEGAVVLKECDGVIPARTPCIIECSNSNSANNRLDITDEGAKADVSGNMLRGVFFDNNDAIHYNRTPYDKTTMRSLTVVDGKLTFATANFDFVPRNQAYLSISDPVLQTFANVRLLKEEEVDAYMEELQFLHSKISAIVIDPATVTVDRGETLDLNVTTVPAEPSNPGLTWTSSDPSVATVSGGAVTGVGMGTCTVTASSDNGVTATAEIKVVVMPHEVTLDVSELRLESQETYKLTATLMPEDVTETKLKWTSDNQDAAVVDSKGLVRARFPGECTISVTTVNGLTAECHVISGDGAVGEITVEGDAEVFDLQGNRVESMSVGGVYIVRKDGKTFKMIVK